MNLTVKELFPRGAQGSSEALVVTGGFDGGGDSFLTSTSISKDKPDGSGGSIEVAEIRSGEVHSPGQGPPDCESLGAHLVHLCLSSS